MKLHELKYTEGARKARKRVGRGTSSGTGKTSSRGQKGQGARSGGGKKPGFEGGQTPLFMRLPKRGFTNFNRLEYAIVNLEQLNKFEDGSTVSPTDLKEAGLIKNEAMLITKKQFSWLLDGLSIHQSKAFHEMKQRIF